MELAEQGLGLSGTIGTTLWCSEPISKPEVGAFSAPA